MKKNSYPALTLIVLAAAQASAEVVRFDIDSHADVLGGRSFGDAGSYEKFAGTVHFAVDPENSANQIITDIEYAPTNADGKVEFSATFMLIKPKDMARANGAVLLDLANRGTKRSLTHFNHASAEGTGWDAADPTTEANFGDGFLLEEGYTLLWVGWQFDVPSGRRGAMRTSVPDIAPAEPIEGPVRIDFVINSDARLTEPAYVRMLSDRNHLAYPVANPDDPRNVLTVRDYAEAERRIIPRDQWQFARLENGRVIPDTTHLYLPGGFEPNRIYEIIYRSQNPGVAGLGLAGVRDIISFFKYGSSSELNLPQDSIDRAIGFGSSQPARVYRVMLYYGFNSDERNRKVFDGVFSHVPGGSLGSFNHRFAQPSRDAHVFLNFFYPVDIFPFSDVAQTDPVTGRTDGVLANVPQEFMPKIIYTLSSYEYWGRSGSPIHTTVDGTADVAMMDNVRLYHFTGTEHLPKPFPPTPEAGFRGQYPNNTNDYTWMLRALLTGLDRWITDGEPAPPSRYPRIDDGTLALPAEVAERFPDLPGIEFPLVHQTAYRLDWGPRFWSDGIIDKEPPDVGPAFPILVPQVNADGNEIGGLQTPELAVPLATYTGWNWYNEEYGRTDLIARMLGSHLPFAKTREERERNGDPRPSIEERYDSRGQYLGLIREKADELVEQGYLLERDVARILTQAEVRWDHLTR